MDEDQEPATHSEAEEEHEVLQPGIAELIAIRKESDDGADATDDHEDRGQIAPLREVDWRGKGSCCI
jgi:hypothetical protein